MGKNGIAAVMVIYKKQILEANTYLTLLNNCSVPVLIYDNSPHQQIPPDLDSIDYFHNPQNPGVSKAYNDAMAWATKKGCSHLLLLDSDSSFPVNAFSLYKQEMLQNPDAVILPAMFSGGHKISPFYFKWGKSHYGDSIKFGKIRLGQIVAINSGMLVPLKAFDEAGRFNEQLPLDWSDIVFIRKLSKKNTPAIHISMEVLHSLSEHEEGGKESAKYRYRFYLKGIGIVSENIVERLLMLFWAKLKALKLGLKYRSIWFFSHYLRNFYG